MAGEQPHPVGAYLHQPAATRNDPSFDHLVGAGEQRGAEGRERRDQLFSSRLSSLKKRQSVPCEMILLGVDLIMPDSCNRSA
jgi:hypothetical protein